MTQAVKESLQRMAMMRSYMRAISSGKDFDESKLERVGLEAHQTKQMYRLLAIAKYDDRFVIPTSKKKQEWMCTVHKVQQGMTSLVQ